VNDTLSILFIRLCKMSLSYEESDIFFEQRGGGVRFRFTSLRDFGRLMLGPSCVTVPMHMHEPWAAIEFLVM